MTEGNGHPVESNFSTESRLVLRALEGAGMNADYHKSLTEKITAMAEVLARFHTSRRALGDSGKYTAQGLKEAAADLAATAAGEVRRIGAMDGLLNNLRQVESQLTPQPQGDATAQLLAFWSGMEVRAELARKGISPDDPVQFGLAYQSALAENNHALQQAMENWPLGHRLDAALIQQGQQQRQAAVNPVAAKKRDELVQYRDVLQRSLADALRELPLAQPDDIAARATSRASESESNS